MNARRRAARSVSLGLAVVVALAVASSPVLARFVGTATADATFATDSLDAPTNLAASASLGLTAVLTWTPVLDSYAEGYVVYRSGSSGTFTIVRTVSGRTTSSTTDTPLVPGQYRYEVRAYAGGWLSPPSNQVSVVVL